MALSRNFSESTEEYYEKPLRVVCAPAEIRIGMLLNTNQN